MFICHTNKKVDYFNTEYIKFKNLTTKNEKGIDIIIRKNKYMLINGQNALLKEYKNKLFIYAVNSKGESIIIEEDKFKDKKTKELYYQFAYSMTVYVIQGQTIRNKKVILLLEDKEIDTLRSIYVALSRVTKMQDLILFKCE